MWLLTEPPLWSSDQSSWLQIQRSGFDSRPYQIFWEVMGLERGSFSLVDTTVELLGRKSRGSGLENRDYDRRNPPRWLRNSLYPQKLTLTSPTSSGRSVGIVRSRTQATKFYTGIIFKSVNNRYPHGYLARQCFVAENLLYQTALLCILHPMSFSGNKWEALLLE
jgi:hypothetical protein